MFQNFHVEVPKAQHGECNGMEQLPHVTVDRMGQATARTCDETGWFKWRYIVQVHFLQR